MENNNWLKEIVNLNSLLSKLMRYAPTDLEDILFIIDSAKLSPGDISLELNNAQIPDLPEIQGQFALCRNWLKARSLCK